MVFKYQAYTRDKKLVQGILEVASESVAEATLYQAGFQRIISIEEAKPGPSLEKLIPSLFNVKTQEIIDFSSQLATLLDSGINLVTALELLGGQSNRKVFKKIIAGLVREIQGGKSLSQALGKYPQTFNNTYCQMIKASEQAGHMELGLKQAGVYLEKQAAANQKIRQAMMYPAFVLLMAVGVCVLLVTIALPPLTNLFKSLGAELPWMTKLLIGTAGFLSDRGLYVLGGILLVILISGFLLRLESVKEARDNFFLKIPVIGTINIERSMQYFCQTTAMLLQAGLRLPMIMEIIIQTNRNRVIRRALGQVRESLIQGEGLSQPMSKNPLFPPLLVEMVVVGEKTGSMDTTLTTLSDFYEKKVSRRIDILISMIEPVLTVIVGLVVIFIALSIITPLYSILRSMH
jgi:type IV pilus assembly protein PilC